YFGSSVTWAPLTSLSVVFEETAAGNLDFAVVPLENSTDGRVIDTLLLFDQVPLMILAEIPLRIHHCVLGSGGLSDIRKVVSKPQALSQCREWIAKNLPRAELEEAPSTTAAVERARAQSHVAVIASRRAGLEYELTVLAANIEDQKDNLTRFALVGRNAEDGPDSAPLKEAPPLRTGNDKTALLFQLAHQPGALADAMQIFKRHKLNLTWIESFPGRIAGGRQEYLFFVEFEGHRCEVRPKRAIQALGRKTTRLNVLGSYAKAAAVG
ncbi:MAG TPA: prephenate dehydratase domain-containing protein, partial [Pirellulaceae bacterium]